MLPVSVNRQNFSNYEIAAEECAFAIATQLDNAVREQGRAVLAISAPENFKLLLDILSHADIPWSAITVTLLAECYVSADEEPPQETIIRKILLQNKAANARFVGLYMQARTTELAAFSASARIQHLKRPFDCVILDMDFDGHTAGFFKESSRLKQALNINSRALVVPNYVRAYGKTYLAVTLPLIVSADLIVLPLQGQQKLITLEKALQGADIEETPIGAVLREVDNPVEVFWSE